MSDQPETTKLPRLDAQFEAAPLRPKRSPERYAAILADQEKTWPIHLAGTKEGNPFATLCQHCYGRHTPP